jgi:hypothetical protein
VRVNQEVQLFIYAIVLIVSCLFLLLARMTNSRQQKGIAYFCILVITIFAAMRGYVGTDTYAYHLMFGDYSNIDVLDAARNIEPLFVILIKFTAIVSNSSFLFVGLISVIQGFLLYRLVKTSNNPADFLVIYIAIFYLNFEFNILRAGTAILILILASRVLREEAGKEFYWLGIAAVLTHYSAIIGFLPLAYFRQKNISTKIITIISIVVAASLMSYFVMTNEALYGKYLIYSEELGSNFSDETNRSFYFSLPLYFLLYISVVRKENAFNITSLFLIWFFLRWATTLFMIVGRVELIVNALLLFFVIEHVLSGWRKQIRSVALVSLVIMWLYGNLNVLDRVDPVSSGGVDLDSTHLMSPYNPYKFFWDEP